MYFLLEAISNGAQQNIFSWEALVMVPNKILFFLGAISNGAQQNNFEIKMMSNSFQIFGNTHLLNLKYGPGIRYICYIG